MNWTYFAQMLIAAIGLSLIWVAVKAIYKRLKHGKGEG